MTDDFAALTTVLTLLGGGLAVWGWIVARLARGQSVVTWQPRRPVPWRGFHVLAVVWVFLLLMMFVPATVVMLAGSRKAALLKEMPAAAEKPQPQSADQPPASARDTAHGSRSEPLQEQHGIMQVLLRRHDAWAVLVCFLSAAVTAPLCEEFIFRLVLQGWLEARAWQWRRRRRLHQLSRLPFGLIPVVSVAVIFGAIHYRAPHATAESTEVLLSSFVGVALAHLLTILVGVALLRIDAGATAADLGWDRTRWRSDIALGLLSFVAMALIIYPLQITLAWVLPRSALADPLSLTVFGLALGVLYLRTHRIVPSIVLHLALNLTTLLLWAVGLAR